MILLIPTNDGISLAPDIDTANAFRYLVINNGIVADDHLIKVENRSTAGFLSDLPNKVTGLLPGGFKQENLKNKKDEITIMTSGLSQNLKDIIQSNSCSHLLTNEYIITNIIIDFIRNHALRESDYCCSP